ncbi:hypothetical protein [Clostridium sp. Marseille-Q7071]
MLDLKRKTYKNKKKLIIKLWMMRRKEDESFENYKKVSERQLEYDKLYDEARSTC